MIALLTRETFEMINVRPRTHDHFEGWNDLAARSAVAGVPEEPGNSLFSKIVFV